MGSSHISGLLLYPDGPRSEPSDHADVSARAVWEVVLLFSEAESARFGLRVFRHKTDRLDPSSLLDQMFESRSDVVILRIPTSRQPEVAELAELGVPYHAADTLVYYSCDLGAPILREVRNPGIELRECVPGDDVELARMVEAVFHDYTNHYSANPLLNDDDVVAGYVEWALSYIGHPRRYACFTVLGDQRVALSTCRHDGSSVEIALSGVLPDAEGRGIYGDTLQLIRQRYAEAGYQRLSISTQVQNVAVQRAWVKQGLQPEESEVTFHLNSLLATSRQDPIEAQFEWPGSDTTTGVLNAVADHYRASFPGPGYSISRFDFRLVRDTGTKESQRMRISFPALGETIKSTVTVSGPDGLTALAYCELNQPPIA